MTQPACCPTCGVALPPNSPRGHCPRCLLRAAFGDITNERSGASQIRDSRIRSRPGVLNTLAASIGSVPRILLHDAETEPDADGVVMPGSPEMPGPADRAGRLRLLGEIARGGMGAILKGRDEDLGRDLAVKVLLEAHCDHPDLVRRFVEEAQICGQLQHPGIVPIYELGTFEDRRPYFAMKLVKGQTLASLLSECAQVRCARLPAL